MPLPAQIIFGVIFTVACCVVMFAGTLYVGGLAFILLLPFGVVVLEIRNKWDWRGFPLGVLLGLLLIVIASLFLPTL